MTRVPRYGTEVLALWTCLCLFFRDRPPVRRQPYGMDVAGGPGAGSQGALWQGGGGRWRLRWSEWEGGGFHVSSVVARLAGMHLHLHGIHSSAPPPAFLVLSTSLRPSAPL